LVIEKRSETGTPIGDGRVRNPYIEGGSQNQADVSERVFAEVEHGYGCDDEENRMPHALEICFTEQSRHGRRGDGIAFESEE